MTIRSLWGLLALALVGCVGSSTFSPQQAATVKVQTRAEYVALERLSSSVRASGRLNDIFAGTITVPDVAGESEVNTLEVSDENQRTILAGFNDNGVMMNVMQAICGGNIDPSAAKRWGSKAQALRFAAALCVDTDPAGREVHAFVVILGLSDEGVDP
jgi:hypothetical protein